MKTTLSLALSMLFALPVLAQRGATYEKILLPLVIQNEVPGGFGSRWTTRVAINNTAAHAVDLLGYNYAPRGCGILCAERPLTEPAVTFFPTVTTGKVTQGAILRVEPAFSAAIAVNLRVQDVSRQSQTWGTELPVVRESEFRRGRFSLPDVPLSSGFRLMLRAYDPDAIGGRFIVRFYRVVPTVDTTYDPLAPPQKDILLGERSFSFVTEARAETPLFDLGYAELPNLASLPELQGVDRIRIEIEPTAATQRVWAFVSITNNETQHVTTVTPQ